MGLLQLNNQKLKRFLNNYSKVCVPLCPKCVRIRRWLKELNEIHPEIVLKKYNLVTNRQKGKEHKIKTIPTLIIGDVKLGGLIQKEEFDAALEKLLKK